MKVWSYRKAVQWMWIPSLKCVDLCCVCALRSPQLPIIHQWTLWFIALFLKWKSKQVILTLEPASESPRGREHPSSGQHPFPFYPSPLHPQFLIPQIWSDISVLHLHKPCSRNRTWEEARRLVQLGMVLQQVGTQPANKAMQLGLLALPIYILTSFLFQCFSFDEMGMVMVTLQCWQSGQ